MNRRLRLKNTNDIQRVRRFGKSIAHPLFVFQALVTQQPDVRIAVIAGRLFSGAVDRNRAKRRLREAARRLHPYFKPGWDILLIARNPILDASFDEIQASLKHLSIKVGCIALPNENS